MVQWKCSDIGMPSDAFNAVAILKYLWHIYTACRNARCRNARIASAVISTAIPSVHLSVCLSHAGIVSKR